MGNKLMVFEGNNVEIIELNGKVLFNPYHVGACLDMAKETIKDHIKEFDTDEVIKIKNSEIEKGGLTNFRKIHNTGENFLTEEGVYALIFKSRKPEALKFQKWVTKEVLPSIRKNGGYISNQEQLTPEQIVANALVVAQNIIANQNNQIVEMQPKAEFYDAVVGSPDTLDMAQVAKVLNIKGIGRNKLFEILRNEKILMGNNNPMQKYVDLGWFRLVESKFQKPNGDTCINIKTVVFQKGLEGIRKLVEKAG